jgi:hypothetical protein
MNLINFDKEHVHSSDAFIRTFPLSQTHKTTPTQLFGKYMLLSTGEETPIQGHVYFPKRCIDVVFCVCDKGGVVMSAVKRILRNLKYILVSTNNTYIGNIVPVPAMETFAYMRCAGLSSPLTNLGTT